MKDESFNDHLDAAILEEKAKRIKKLVERNFSKSFIMELFDLDEKTYGSIYRRLYPFGRFTGPFGKFAEKDFKMRMLKKAGYSDEEILAILEEAALFFPEEVEGRLREVEKKEAYMGLISDFLKEGKTESWIRNKLSLTQEEFEGFKLGAERD